MIDIIIFSYNRAMQLNTLLTSVYEFFPQPYTISVLYNCTSNMMRGYELLKKKFPEVKFVKEDKYAEGYKLAELIKPFNLKRYIAYKYIRKPKSNFRTNLISILKNSASPYVMFLTDDSVFIRSVVLDKKAMSRISESPTEVQYSLRLGKHINNPNSYSLKSDIIEWDFYDSKNERDWRYNFSVDAHVYDRNFVLNLARDIIFSNPNSYESFTKIRICRKGFQKRGIAPLEPYILSFPINIVQEVQDNESLSVSTEQLERLFLDGYTLKYKIPDIIDTFQYYPKVLYLEKDGESTELKTGK